MHSAAKTISQDQLVRLLRRIDGAFLVNFSAFTEVSNVRQKVLLPNRTAIANPFEHIYKYVNVQGYVGKYHGNGRVWGERICPALIQKGDNYYLPVDVIHTDGAIYIGRNEQNRLIRVYFEDIAKFLPAIKPYKEENFYIRNYSIGAIAAIEVNGLRYRIRNHLL